MAEYAITFARSARKELEKLDADIIGRIFPKIEKLAREPRPFGCRKIRGARDLWRIRVGNYRVIYHIREDRKLVDIVAVRHRRQAYMFD